MGTILAIADRINKRHEEVIQKRALTGNVRALILTWQRAVGDKFKIQTGDFTARSRGNMQDLLSRFGAETSVNIIEWAVENWKTLAETKYMKLPPLPVFVDFYYNRERILATWEESKKRGRRAYFDTKPIEPEPEITTPQKTLTEIFAEEKKKRQQK